MKDFNKNVLIFTFKNQSLPKEIVWEIQRSNKYSRFLLAYLAGKKFQLPSSPTDQNQAKMISQLDKQ